MIPFQLSPVDTRNNVRKAMPKLVKVACLLRPSQGLSSLHSARESPHTFRALLSQWDWTRSAHTPHAGVAGTWGPGLCPTLNLSSADSTVGLSKHSQALGLASLLVDGRWQAVGFSGEQGGLAVKPGYRIYHGELGGREERICKNLL